MRTTSHLKIQPDPVDAYASLRDSRGYAGYCERNVTEPIAEIQEESIGPPVTPLWCPWIWRRSRA